MNEKQAKAAFLKQIKPMTKRMAAEQKRKTPFRRNQDLRQTRDFWGKIQPGPVFAGRFTDATRGKVEIFVPILFSVTDEFKPGAVIDSEAKFARLLSLAEGT